MRNIVRTPVVELQSIPAMAYKQKLTGASGAAIRILRLDEDANAAFVLDKRGGSPVAYRPYNKELFPDIAVTEAMDALQGLPLSVRGKVVITEFNPVVEECEVEEEDGDEELDMVNSPEYVALVKKYTDKTNRFNFGLMNKDFIQFASRSKQVAKMLANEVAEDDIIRAILQDRAAFVSGQKLAMTDKEANALIDTLNEINPRSPFKELRLHLRMNAGTTKRA